MMKKGVLKGTCKGGKRAAGQGRFEKTEIEIRHGKKETTLLLCHHDVGEPQAKRDEPGPHCAFPEMLIFFFFLSFAPHTRI